MFNAALRTNFFTNQFKTLHFLWIRKYYCTNFKKAQNP